MKVSKQKLQSYWEKIANARDSDAILLEIQKMLFDIFDAQYAIVFIAPEYPSDKLPSDFFFTTEIVAEPEVSSGVPEELKMDIKDEGKKYLSAEVAAQKLIDEFVRMGAMDIEGKDHLIRHIFLEDHYIGFISLHRKKRFTAAEKRLLDSFMPIFKIAMRAAIYASLLEETPKYIFSYLVNELAKRFNLTPNEAEVVKGILSGNDIKLIAKERGVSVAAVKKIIRSIYQKTGVHRRTELLRLILFPGVKYL